MSAPVSAGPFVLSIIGGMEIDGEERRGLFLSGDVQKLRGLGEFLGDDVYLSRADIAADLLAALEAAVECGMVPTSTAKNGGAPSYARQAHVADQIRAAISRAPGAS